MQDAIKDCSEKELDAFATRHRPSAICFSLQKQNTRTNFTIMLSVSVSQASPLVLNTIIQLVSRNILRAGIHRLTTVGAREAIVVLDVSESSLWNFLRL